MTEFLPHFPLHLNSLAIFGITLLLGIAGGQVAKKIPFIPQISGYILMGFLVGPGGFNLVNHSVLHLSHLFVDISLSLILFDLGRQLDFTWLRHDLGLVFMSLTESALTFILTFSILCLFVNLSHLQAALAAAIAIATSPAVVMMVANDLSSEGPVTRRALILTSMNNLFALLIFTILLPFTQQTQQALLFAQISYTLLGSFVLGMFLFIVTKLIASFIGKQKENQFVLVVGAVVLTIGLAYSLKLSTMLALFTLGVAARNLDWNHDLMEIDFGWLARLFFILLFVVIGSHLQLQGLWMAPGVVTVFLLVRILAKSSSVLLFYKRCRLTFRQASALSISLFPMAGLAIGLSNLLLIFNPDLGHSLVSIIMAAVALLNIIGPILTQYAFVMTGEALASTKQA